MVNKRNKGQFNSEREVKKRGKSFKTKLFDSIKQNALIGMNEKSSLEDIEAAYLSHFAKRAFSDDDSSSAMLLKTLIDKSYPSIKSIMPSVDFEFDESSKPMEQANQIIKAASSGQIPADIAVIFVQCIKNCIDIEEYTDLKDRIEKIEESLGLKNE